MFPIFFSEISGMFPTVLTFPEKFASLTIAFFRLVILLSIHVYALIRDANFSGNVKTVGNIPEISEEKIGNIQKFSDL